MKRDGSTVLDALEWDLLYNETSTARAGGLLAEIDFIPKLAKQLQHNPEEVIASFKEIRKSCKLRFFDIDESTFISSP